MRYYFAGLIFCSFPFSHQFQIAHIFPRTHIILSDAFALCLYECDARLFTLSVSVWMARWLWLALERKCIGTGALRMNFGGTLISLCMKLQQTTLFLDSAGLRCRSLTSSNGNQFECGSHPSLRSPGSSSSENSTFVHPCPSSPPGSSNEFFVGDERSRRSNDFATERTRFTQMNPDATSS